MEYLLDLGEFAGGALQEKAEEAMRKVIANMQDPNTPWKTQRQIVVKITFTQNEDRDDAAVAVAVDTKLAPASPVGTRMAVGIDLASGQAYAQEYGKQVRGQMSFNDLEPHLSEAVQELDGETADAGAEAGRDAALWIKRGFNIGIGILAGRRNGCTILRNARFVGATEN